MILELLEKQEDKVNISEMAELARLMPERVTKSIPSCIWHDPEEPDPVDAMALLRGIIAVYKDDTKHHDDLIETLNSAKEQLESVPVAIPLLDYEVFNLLLWILARRENPDITIKEVGDLIGLNSVEKMGDLTTEVIYFYTRMTREDIEGSQESDGDADPPPEEDIPSETS